MSVRILSLLFAISLATSAGRAAAPSVPRPLDDHGDPLPDGAAARLGTLRWRPGVWLEDLAWSPDGRHVASADGSQHTVRLWDVKSGRVVRTFFGHRGGGRVSSVAFSADGKRLVSAGADGTARVWDVASGEQLLVLTGPQAEMLKAAFSLDGKSVAVVGAADPKRLSNQKRDKGATLIRYDASSGTEQSRFTVETGTYAALSADGSRLAAVTRNKNKRGEAVQVREVDTGRVVCTITGGGGPNLAISHDGRLVVVRGSLTEPTAVFKATTAAKVFSLPKRYAGAASRASFSPDGKRLLVDDDKDQLVCWDVETRKQTHAFDHTFKILARAFSPDGKKLIGQGSPGAGAQPLRVWDVEKGTLLSGKGGQADVAALAFSPDGKHLLAAGQGGEARLWDVKARRVVRELQAPDVGPRAKTSAVAFSRDGKKAAAVLMTGPTLVWDVEAGKLMREFKAVKPPMFQHVVFSADGDTVFGAGRTAAVYRWDLKAGKALEPLTAAGVRGVRSLTLSKDGRTLSASAMTSGVTAVFDAATGKLLRTIEQEKGGAGT